MNRTGIETVGTPETELQRSQAVGGSFALASGPRYQGCTIGSRRLLGAFYTPDDLAITLTRWALSDGPGTVLDPSYGGCAFLRAAVAVLRDHKVKKPRDLVFGVDIDPLCVRYAEGLVAPKNHITSNFLALRPNEIPGFPFKAIVGNPPYVRHHWLKGSQRKVARDAINTAGVRLRETASTWAYFVVHSIGFLADEGRLALLVPEAVLQADYAVDVRELLCRRFRRVVLVHIRDRIFKDTDEPVVIIAAEGRGPGTIRIESIASAAELPNALARKTIIARSNDTSLRTVVDNGRTTSADLLSLVDELIALDDVVTMGDVAVIRIGLVTGANEFFIRSRADLQRMGIPSRAVVPVVARTRWLAGLSFGSGDHRGLTSLGRRSLLIRPSDGLLDNSSVRRWIAEGEQAGINARQKCRQRDPWFRLSLGVSPDAFATCSRMGSPLLVLNKAGFQCSNALHAVRWHDRKYHFSEAISVCMLTSLPAVWSELHGRRYGGGVLKLEPGTLCRLPLPLVESAGRAFAELDAFLRNGEEERARCVADDLVLRRALGISARDISRLQQAQKAMRVQRIPLRSGGTDG